jgi:hypothetical protein
MSRERAKCVFCGRKIHPLSQDYVVFKQGGEKTWFCEKCWDELEMIGNSLTSQEIMLDKLVREFAGLKQTVEELLAKFNRRRKT